MSRFISLLAVASGLLAAACSIQIPDATYVCGPTEACPSGFVCSEGLCRREAVDAGPLLDGDVDGGDEDGGACHPETCNGSDDDCDGVVDDGVMSVFDSEDVASTSGTFWSRFLATEDGGFVVVSALPDAVAGDTAIVASRYDASGAVAVASLELVRAQSSHFEATLFESHLYILRETPTTDELVLDQFEVASLTRVGVVLTVVGQHADNFYDVVGEATPFGDRVAVVYRSSDEITRVSTIAVPALTAESSSSIHTPTVDDPAFTIASIVSAPCGQGLYVQLTRLGAESMSRVLPLDSSGALVADGHDIIPPAPDVVYAVARPLVVGGSCSAPPAELIVSWVEADGFPDASDHTTLHIDSLAVTHSATEPLQTFSRADGTAFDPENFINPAAAFTIHWPVTLTRFADGRVFVGLSTTGPLAANTSVDVYELQPGFAERTLHATNAAPTSALQLDFASAHSSTSTFLLGGGRWTTNGTAAFFKLGCATE